MKPSPLFHLRVFATFSLLLLVCLPVLCAQEAMQRPAEKRTKTEAAETEPQLPAQIELLETHIRFETNGDSRKEVHTRVHINNELGVRQFARLNFDFNRAFESIEIPMVHITHASGGTADILPSAITDNPNPAVVNYPAYQDVRVKSVRILGLEPGDLLEYRIITKTTGSPLAPDYWLRHSFDRSGIVQGEDFVLDLPAGVRVQINPKAPADSVEESGEADAARRRFHWLHTKNPNPSVAMSEQKDAAADIIVNTLDDYGKLANKLASLLYPKVTAVAAIRSKAETFFAQGRNQTERVRAIYDFVSKDITTVDLQIGSAGYRSRKPEDILASDYATQEDKAALFAALAREITVEPYLYLTFPDSETTPAALPATFEHVLVGGYPDGNWVVLDPALEVAPFGMISAKFRGKPVFCATRTGGDGHGMVVSLLPVLPNELPQPTFQRVETTATLNSAGTLIAKVTYRLRGDNELLLRVAFHQSPKEKWKDLAQLLALSDGFRGQVSNVTASDPYATREPFTVEYEITTPKFVDWSKKPVRIPALLPQVAVPDPPAKPAAGAAVSPIELGTPLEVETQATLHLPPGTTAVTPTGISVTRDYATFSSKYSVSGLTLTASRHINFLLREVPATRVADYNTFLRAVQNDQAQDFTLERPAPPLPDHPPSLASKP